MMILQVPTTNNLTDYWTHYFTEYSHFFTEYSHYFTEHSHYSTGSQNILFKSN